MAKKKVEAPWRPKPLEVAVPDVGEHHDLSEFDESLRHFEALPTLVANMKKGKFHGYTFVEPKKKEPLSIEVQQVAPLKEETPPAKEIVTEKPDKEKHNHKRRREHVPSAESMSASPTKSSTKPSSKGEISSSRSRGHSSNKPAHVKHGRTAATGRESGGGQKREESTRREPRDRKRREESTKSASKRRNSSESSRDDKSAKRKGHKLEKDRSSEQDKKKGEMKDKDKKTEKKRPNKNY